MSEYVYSVDASVAAILKICNRYYDEGFDDSIAPLALETIVDEFMLINEHISNGGNLPTVWSK